MQKHMHSLREFDSIVGFHLLKMSFAGVGFRPWVVVTVATLPHTQAKVAGSNSQPFDDGLEETEANTRSTGMYRTVL